MKLSFLGGASEVTGSNTLVEAGGKKILLDCGLFQGFRFADEKNYEEFAYDPKSIDLVIVGHAHLDHTGRLPKLAKGGFSGRIILTAPTKEIAELVMHDNAKLMKEEAKRNKIAPLYASADIDRVMALMETVAYNQRLEVFPGIFVTLKNAGHILGSATTTLEVEGKTLVYTSDLGNRDCELLSDPEIIDHADYLICETTYGGRVHEDPTKREEKLNTIINNTISRGGVLMIPAFAIERTQELLHDIEQFCEKGNCLIPQFYLDSPLANKVTGVFEKYRDFLSPDLKEANLDIFALHRVKITASVDESKEINETNGPKIIIAGSGMMNGGRILHHVRQYIDDPKNAILFVGFQAEGTLGRRILEGEKEIKIFGEKHVVGAQVLAIGSYSAHADSQQLLDWISPIKGLKKVFLFHGERSQSEVFRGKLKDKLNIDAEIPNLGESYEI